MYSESIILTCDISKPCQYLTIGRALSDAISPPIMPGLEKLTIRSPGDWPIEDMEQTKPSAKNGWSVSASVGSDNDAKQTKPSSANRWRISGSIGSGRDAKQSVGSGKGHL